MSQILLTNKKQGNQDWSNIIKPAQTREKYTFCVKKSLAHLKNLKNGCFPYVDLELTNHTCHEKPNPSRETVPLRFRVFVCCSWILGESTAPPTVTRTMLDEW